MTGSTLSYADRRQASRFVDAAPIRGHVRALIAAGVRAARIEQLSGVNRRSIDRLMLGGPAHNWGPSSLVPAETARRLLALAVPNVPRELVDGDQSVPAVGATRRLQALAALGYSQAYLCERLDLEPNEAAAVFLGQRQQVPAETARKVVSLFTELQMIPGPNSEARRQAGALGWAPPLAWDEEAIDDPAARPDTGKRRRPRFVETYTELRELGYRDDQIAARFGIKTESLEQRMRRYGLRRSAA